jgi:diacylglycerol kinase (CTP)
MAEQAVQFKQRSDMHWRRKLWHMGGVSIIALVYAFLPEPIALFLMSIAFFVFVPLDILRQKNEGLNKFILGLFQPIMREYERNRLAGTTYLLSGLMLVTLVFPRPIVLLTMMYLAFADPIASYFGIRFGKDKILGSKSIQGTLAAFVVCAILTALTLSSGGTLSDRAITISLLGGVIGALAELIPVWDLDDNLTLPLLSASGLWILFLMFGGF